MSASANSDSFDEIDFMNSVRARARLIDAVNLSDEAEAKSRLLSEIAELDEELDQFDRRHNSDRVGGWIPTHHGWRVWLQDPRPGDFHISDIAATLSRINRFGGAIRCDHYSVAEHSLNVCDLLPPKAQLAGLMHDAAEAYLGDVVTPVKDLIRPLFGPLEEAMTRAIAVQFGFWEALNKYEDIIKKADQQVLLAEARLFSGPGYINGNLGLAPAGVRDLRPMSPVEATYRFLVRFRELTSGNTK